MATKTTPPVKPGATQKIGPQHQSFSWIYSTDFDPRAQFVEKIYDVCRGVEVCLEIVMNEQLRVQSHGDDDTDPEDLSLVGTHNTERLLRLALVATRMLGDGADAVISEINRAARKEYGGKKE